MIYGSVCSGIEAASVAWHPLGWRAAWLAEIERFPSEVLAHHYPDVPNLGDMTTISDKVLSGDVAAPDILVGGTPCQAFSVAGLRGGLKDPRGALTISFVELANAIDTTRSVRGLPESIIVWENVPGVLSSKDNAFGCFLGALAGESCELQPAGGKWADAGCVFGPSRAIAWRILDAQYFGVAQRRRRVFVVSSARDGFDPAAVLFEFEGLRRDLAPSREAGKDPAAGAVSGAAGCWWDGGQVSQTLDAVLSKGQTMPEKNRFPAVLQPAFGIPGNWIGRKPANGGNAVEPMLDVSPCQTKTDRHAVAYGFQPRIGRNGRGDMGDVVNALTAQAGETGKGDAAPCVALPMAVRRLTPTECERLQGFPDGYTDIRPKGKDTPDGPRYKALGNSMAVPCMAWIGSRIQQWSAAK